MESLINIGILLTYVMVAFAALTVIGFGLKRMTKKTLYTIGGLVAISMLSYLISSDEVLVSYEKYDLTASTAKRVGMGLTTFYILAIGAIGAVVYSELSKVFSK